MLRHVANARRAVEQMSEALNRHDGEVRSAPPVVFVHGLFGSFVDAAATRQLRPTPCSAPDLVGYGRSTQGAVTVEAQVDALRSHVESRHPGTRVHLVAHSIGAVYAFALADESPDLVESVTTVEGNFTLADAFWSRSIAALDEDRARSEIEGRLRDPRAFLAGDGIEATHEHLAKAVDALAYQPWRTVWMSASAIVETTSKPEYQELLLRVFARHRVHLVAGERSAGGWAVPGWAREAAATSTVIAGVGHMMMLEKPDAVGRVLRELLFTPEGRRAL
jgi:lipase